MRPAMGRPGSACLRIAPPDVRSFETYLRFGMAIAVARYCGEGRWRACFTQPVGTAHGALFEAGCTLDEVRNSCRRFSASRRPMPRTVTNAASCDLRGLDLPCSQW